VDEGEVAVVLLDSAGGDGGGICAGAKQKQVPHTARKRARAVAQELECHRYGGDEEIVEMGDGTRGCGVKRRQNLSSGAEAQAQGRVTWGLKPPPPLGNSGNPRWPGCGGQAEADVFGDDLWRVETVP
jgi:hypothetical protein